MCLPFGALFREIWYSDRGFHQRQSSNYINWVYFGQIIVKSTQSELGAFLSKMVYWWVGNKAKNWYRESQIFEVWQGHARTILGESNPLRGLHLWTWIWLRFLFTLQKKCKLMTSIQSIFKNKLLKSNFKIWLLLMRPKSTCTWPKSTCTCLHLS